MTATKPDADPHPHSQAVAVSAYELRALAQFDSKLNEIRIIQVRMMAGLEQVGATLADYRPKREKPEDQVLTILFLLIMFAQVCFVTYQVLFAPPQKVICESIVTKK